MALLSGLDKVNWGSIKHAYGSAKDIPAYLKMLAKNNNKTWSKALTYIWENSNHQNSIYEATPYVAPFLLELLENLPSSRTTDLLRLLADNAWSLENSHGQWWVELTNQNVATGHLSIEMRDYYFKPVQETRAFFEDNLQRFLPYLSHSNPDVRGYSAVLLFPFLNFPIVSEAIQKQRMIETNEIVRKALETGWMD